jgi:hypothetical protein
VATVKVEAKNEPERKAPNKPSVPILVTITLKNGIREIIKVKIKLRVNKIML